MFEAFSNPVETLSETSALTFSHDFWDNDARAYNYMISFSSVEPFGNLFCKISQDATGSGAAKCHHAFEHTFFFVQSTGARRHLEHRILAGYLIDRHWDRERIVQSADNIQVWHARFHHHDISTFLNIESNFSDRFVGVGWIHLVRFLRRTT